jgi:hypothetical protein
VTLLELAAQVDPLSAGLVVAFWARWERWARRHRAEHDALQRLVPHEVTHG